MLQKKGGTVAIGVAHRTVERNGKAAKRAAQAGNRPEFSRLQRQRPAAISISPVNSSTRIGSFVMPLRL